MSLYNSEPPGMEIICAMSEWKEASTVSGLIVRAAESNSCLRMLDKFQILYLAFASTPFLIKMACVIGESKTERNIAYWLQKFIGAVEEALVNEISEEEYFHMEDHETLMDAHDRNMKTTSGTENDDRYQILRVIDHKFTLAMLLLPIIAIGRKSFVTSIVLSGNWNHLQME